jgi:uncharacterized membrane protein SpoIIM required for sporulation
VLAAALIFLAAAVSGCLMVLFDHELFAALVPEGVSQGRNYGATPGELLSEELFQPWGGFEDSFIHFASFLFRHNSEISLLAFGLGFCLGLPTILLLFSNGLSLGAMAALHIDKGLGLDFLAWLSIHGVTELSAVILASAGGLAIAEAVVVPGRRSRSQNLAVQGHRAARLMVGALILLFLAGVLEGGFRQLLASTPLRLLVGLATGVFWWRYFARGARQDHGGPGVPGVSGVSGAPGGPGRPPEA